MAARIEVFNCNAARRRRAPGCDQQGQQEHGRAEIHGALVKTQLKVAAAHPLRE
jgi:hypothetical protein